ncbi:MAG: fructosamine kinase family protein [Sedimenticola sp.]|nr:fructosamine kinase family protein [Sedimenticola sp.]
MNSALSSAILEQINRATGLNVRHCSIQSIGGGCINQAFQLKTDKTTFFVKTNRADRLGMFVRESGGLQLLTASNTLRTPNVIGYGSAEGTAYLIMENIPMGGNGRAETAGRQLALLHRKKADRFGSTADNFIGSTPQINQSCDSWASFWQQHRLGFQLILAKEKGYHGRLQALGEQLQLQLPAFLDHAPTPSLLHGDLWSGNLDYTTKGEPIIYDPAVYYGDRETDLAMTELFGGFSDRFYAAYCEEWPLAPGYSVRKTLYNLYHILNHLNLFGSGYEQQAIAMMQRLLAEVSA